MARTFTTDAGTKVFEIQGVQFLFAEDNNDLTGLIKNGSLFCPDYLHVDEFEVPHRVSVSLEDLEKVFVNIVVEGLS